MIKGTITEVTPQNVLEETFYCVKDIKNPGFDCKKEWFDKSYKEGLHIGILKDIKGQSIGFIEFVPVSNAWRPVIADNFMFIHCMYIYSKKNKNKGYGSQLVQYAEEKARQNGMAGVCVMTSKGPWMTDKRIFEKNGYTLIDKKDRFELFVKKWDPEAKDPQFLDWTKKRDQYKGWHLLYANQCPWHEKSVEALLKTAMDYEIDLKVHKITSAAEVKQMPSGFGVFNLLHDGKLLEDHYISATRFRNILTKQLALNK